MWRCIVLSWRRDFSRPVKWTDDERLVYADHQERDAILWHLNLTFKRLINHEGIDGFTNHELYRSCVAWLLRKEELTLEQNKER